MGFLPDIKRILAKLPARRQTLMFSATFPKEIERLAARMQNNPVRIEAGTASTPVETIRQGIYTVDPSRKLSLLSKVLSESNVLSALVFSRTKHRTDRVAASLRREGFKVNAIHGGRTQNQRQQAIDGFRKGRYQILVATDIAARGLDVQGITHVVNFDIPATMDDYIHRIGRTARANAVGDAITFVCPNEFTELGSIERGLGRDLPRNDWEGSTPVISLFRSGKKRTESRKRPSSRGRRYAR